MSRSRPLRDLAAALTGAVLVLAAVAWLERLAPGRAALPAVPADDPGELMAWSMRDADAGIELLGVPHAQGLRTCRLPTDGALKPLIDPTTLLPRRVDHWLAGGPRLYLMELNQGFEAGRPPRAVDIAADPARCPSGRVLVSGETIMNFLYVSTAREVADRP